MKEVGDENIYIFALDVEGVEYLLSRGYNLFDYYNTNPLLKASQELLHGDTFTPSEPGILRTVYDALLEGGDPYLCQQTLLLM